MRLGDAYREAYRPLREVVAEHLRSMILSGELAAGERLLEDKLAERLGVSRNPVREAIRVLETTGLVEVVPRQGAYVCQPDLSELRHLLDVRGALEGHAAEAAARHRPEGLIDRLQACIDEGERAGRVRERHGAVWGLCETGAAGPSGNRYGDAAGHTCLAVVGPVMRRQTLETGASDRAANMEAFAAAMLDAFLEALTEADRAP